MWLRQHANIELKQTDFLTFLEVRKVRRLSDNSLWEISLNPYIF